MSKSIKQIADELGVSKTAIRKRFSDDFKSRYVETSAGGSLQVSDEGCKLIAESLRKPPQTVQTPRAETTANQSLRVSPDIQQETIGILTGQLAENHGEPGSVQRTWLRVVYENKVVFADEMDRVLNPVLSERVISFINGKSHLGQFIFSTHNVLHLDLKTYMKEQIYFVAKIRDSLNSELYSLSDFPEVRYETTKIYEFYMKGILGGTAFE